MKNTQELEHQIQHGKNPSLLGADDFTVPNLAVYLNKLLHDRNASVQDVVVGCNLDRSYGYQLFNGTRRPTRNFLLRLAILLKLGMEETQRLLKIAGRQPLYARDRRDAAVLYALTHGLTVEKTDALLESLGEGALL